MSIQEGAAVTEKRQVHGVNPVNVRDSSDCDTTGRNADNGLTLLPERSQFAPHVHRFSVVECVICGMHWRDPVMPKIVVNPGPIEP